MKNKLNDESKIYLCKKCYNNIERYVEIQKMKINKRLKTYNKNNDSDEIDPPFEDSLVYALDYILDNIIIKKEKVNE